MPLPMTWEMKIIQEEFMKHYGVTNVADLLVPDGNYIAYVYDEAFNVIVADNRMTLVLDEEFDTTTATYVNPREGITVSAGGAQ